MPPKPALTWLEAGKRNFSPCRDALVDRIDHRKRAQTFGALHKRWLAGLDGLNYVGEIARMAVAIDVRRVLAVAFHDIRVFGVSFGKSPSLKLVDGKPTDDHSSA